MLRFFGVVYVEKCTIIGCPKIFPKKMFRARSPQFFIQEVMDSTSCLKNQRLLAQKMPRARFYSVFVLFFCLPLPSPLVGIRADPPSSPHLRKFPYSYASLFQGGRPLPDPTSRHLRLAHDQSLPAFVSHLVSHEPPPALQRAAIPPTGGGSVTRLHRSPISACLYHGSRLQLFHQCSLSKSGPDYQPLHGARPFHCRPPDAGRRPADQLPPPTRSTLLWIHHRVAPTALLLAIPPSTSSFTAGRPPCTIINHVVPLASLPLLLVFIGRSVRRTCPLANVKVRTIAAMNKHFF